MSIYYKGTEAQFNTWHSWVCDSSRANIPKMSKILGKERSDLPQTTSYSEKIPHQFNADDYIWTFGNYSKVDMGLTEYTQQQAIDNGYLIDPDA